MLEEHLQELRLPESLRVMFRHDARALSENNSSNDFSVSSASHDLATSPSRI